MNWVRRPIQQELCLSEGRLRSTIEQEQQVEQGPQAYGIALRAFPHPHETYRRTKFFGCLDGLRCFSIVAVVWHHTASRFFSVPLLHQGNRGVELFFVISGFLITTLLLREREKYGEISLRLFYTRRILRIFPLYYTVVLVYVLLVYLSEASSPFGQQFFANLPYFLTYTSNWFVPLGDARVIFYFAWSLATEEQFYLVWPWVERFIKGRGPIYVIAGLVGLNLAMSFGLLDNWIRVGSLLYVILGSIYLPICLGVLLAHLLHSPRGYRAAARVIGRRWSSAAALCLLVALAAVMHRVGVWGIIWVDVAMALLVGSCVVREDHVLAGLLSWRPLAWIGMTSYGVYLTHMLAANLVRRFMHLVSVSSWLMEFALTLALASLFASISFRYYESFFLRLKEYFSRRA